MNQIVNMNDFRNTDANAIFPMGDDINFPVGTRQLSMIGNQGGFSDPIDSHKAVLRIIDGKPACIGVVGSKYNVVKHEDHFKTVETALISSLKAADLEGCYVHDKISNQGAWARRDYIFPSVTAKVETPGITDKLGYACFAWNSYDGSSSVAAVLGTLAFYCTNGQFSMDYDARKLKKHTSGLQLEQFQTMLEAGVQKFYQEADRYQTWADTEVNDDKVEELFKKKFSDLRAKRLQQQYLEEVSTRGRNVWAVWNALTAYASHSSDLFAVRQTGNDNVERTLTGRQAEVHQLVQSPVWNDFVALAA